jgi:hypothetical protein
MKELASQRVDPAGIVDQFDTEYISNRIGCVELRALSVVSANPGD